MNDSHSHDLSTDAFVQVEAIATDNLPNRAGMRLPAVELAAIAQHLTDKPAAVAHPIGDPTGNWGRMVAAWVESLPVPKGLSKVDKQAIATEGYQVVKVAIAVAVDHPYLLEFEMGRMREVSISFSYAQLKCPGCDCGADIYPSWGCPRSVRNQPYLERHGVVDGYEISLVAVPAVKAARVLVSGGK